MPETTGTVVTTFAELKNTLENTDETLVYFGADIQGEAGGIRIPNTKPDVVIDGTYDGVQHTYTDYSTYTTGFGLQTDTIRVYLPAGGTFTVTMQNMKINSVNYYGPMSTPLTDSAYAKVTYIMRGVSYYGPQVAYVGYGGVEYYDSEFVIDGTRFSVSEEFAQCNRVTFGGSITIEHAPAAAVNMFPFEGNAATRAITVKAGADVHITTNRIFFSGGATPFTIEAGASLYIQSTTTLAPAAVFASPFTVGQNASFTYIQTARNAAVATVYCNGSFTVAPGAKVYMEAQYSNSQYLLQFSGASCKLSVADPESFILRAPDAGLVYFPSSTRLELQGGQINYWKKATNAQDPGGLTDIPDFSWRKTAAADGSVTPTYINGGSTNTVFTLDAGGTNLTAEELEGKALSNLLLNSAFVFSIGSLPLRVDTVTDDNYPVQGMTMPGAKIEVGYKAEGVDYSASDTAAKDGSFRAVTTEPIPVTEVVTVYANLPFLISSFVTSAVDAGELAITGLPAQITFTIAKKAALTPKLFGRTDDNWTITVSDTRIRKTAWRLYGAIDGHLTSENNHTLPDAVVFRKEDGTIQLMDTRPLLLWLDETGASTVNVCWAADKGLLMQECANPICVNEQYTASIDWSLEAEENE